MTRFLSHSLQAPEPGFSQSLKQLERANGFPSNDIRLSADVLHQTQRKLIELGLDPHDTTPAELYHVLQQKMRQDDKNLTRKLRTVAASHVSAEADIVAGMTKILRDLPDNKRCFALKASSLRSILKINPPKKAMKQLGYRSMASFLKHESPVSILAASWLVEGENWHKRLVELYKKLQPKDFEARTIQIIPLDTPRWRELAEKVVEKNRHNLIAFKETGSLVLLPLKTDLKPGAVTASLSLALHELNEIRSGSAFLKLSQVRPDFGKIVAKMADEEPRLSSSLLDQPVSWNLIQRYYSNLSDRFRSEIFEPYLELEDMTWRSIEKTLSTIEPSLKFWENTSHIGVLDGHMPVSFNLLDMSINSCNDLPYQRRIVHFFQKSLWQELLLRYLQHQPIEDSVMSELQPILATERALA